MCYNWIKSVQARNSPNGSLYLPYLVEDLTPSCSNSSVECAAQARQNDGHDSFAQEEGQPLAVSAYGRLFLPHDMCVGADSLSGTLAGSSPAPNPKPQKDLPALRWPG